MSNVDFETQDFKRSLAQSGLGNSYLPRTGATAIGTLGYGGNSLFGPQDLTHHISFALPSSAVSIISFVGATNEAATDPNGGFAGNEAHGIDNVLLTGTPAAGPITSPVPGPASWAMLIGGFGPIGVGCVIGGGGRCSATPVPTLRV